MSHSRRAACANARRVTPALNTQDARKRFMDLFKDNKWAAKAMDTVQVPGVRIPKVWKIERRTA